MPLTFSLGRTQSNNCYCTQAGSFVLSNLDNCWTIGGIYRDHLWRQLIKLQENPRLAKTYAEILAAKQGISPILVGFWGKGEGGAPSGDKGRGKGERKNL
ncbi:AAA-like domain-containing protein [Nostoc sp. CALU 1950]|uniref:AAA-like domain-containing protein n=1 Tax=Nostoc sp. CALU 1950 TaxID=3104321 RepID=UPI003EB95517